MANVLDVPAGPSYPRPTLTYSTLPDLSKPFFVDAAQRSYKHQYSNIYFVRLVELRPVVEKRAQESWGGIKGKLDASRASVLKH